MGNDLVLSRLTATVMGIVFLGRLITLVATIVVMVKAIDLYMELGFHTNKSLNLLITLVATIVVMVKATEVFEPEA